MVDLRLEASLTAADVFLADELKRDWTRFLGILKVLVCSKSYSS